MLNERSLKNLEGVHADLVKVVKAADVAAEADGIDFVVTEGVRTLARQRKLLAAGATKTLKSRHLTGHAVDLAALVDGEVRWDWPLYDQLAKYMKEAAENCGVPIEWGGDWRSFKDGPHFQLTWKAYPGTP